MQKTVDVLKKYKLPILAAALGFILLMLPFKADNECIAEGDEQRLESLLEAVQGVGDTRVLLSDNGAVIVCDGGDSADVRLRVINAVSAFTGLPSDKIEVLKIELED